MAVGPDAILVKVVASLVFGTRIWQLKPKRKDMPASNYEVYENRLSRSQAVPLAASQKRMQSSSSILDGHVYKVQRLAVSERPLRMGIGTITRALPQELAPSVLHERIPNWTKSRTVKNKDSHRCNN